MASPLLFYILAAAGQEQPDAEGLEFFERKIRPVLVERCYSCHSARAEKLKGGLRLDTPDGLRGVVTPRDPDASRLVRAIRYADEDLQMPPKGRLPARQVADFEAWVARGAPSPAAPAAASKGAHWAFQPPRPTPVPDVAGATTPIDAFVRAKLAEMGLTPAPPADPRTLVRRLSFDLLGLPPTPEEVDAFVSDPDLGKLVDRLLSSPHYGERWGRHWLDVARYADTAGYTFGERRFPYAYAYRDWVIRAFNEDMPYDRFLSLQIAADRMTRGPDLAALGFLTVGRRFLNNTPDIFDDRIDVVFRGTMALTASCARCHDHKYDPLTAKDYYALYGVFASSPEPDAPPLLGTPTPAYETERKKLEEEATRFREARGAELLAELRKPEEIARYLRAAHELRDRHENDIKPAAKGRKLNPAALARWWYHLKHGRVEGWGPDRVDACAAELSGEPELLDRILFDPAPWLRNLYYPDGGPAEKMPAHPVELLFEGDDLKKLRDLEKKVRELEFTHAGAPARAMALEDAATPFTPRVFIRGNKASLGEEVPRRFPSFLGGQVFTEGSGRLELARAIVSPRNPLTARVWVNRVWAWHFGEGLVRTPSDFGTRSEPPSHPELLDWLARWFVENGGSTKKLHRLILASAVYRQASEGDARNAAVDPENRSLWRMNPRRLDFESLRDSLLAAAGRLDRTLGGRSVPLASSRRRTVYGYVDRQNAPALLRTFDVANPDTHAPQRHLTTAPQQALFMMNSPFVAEQVGHLAGRAKDAPALYRRLFGRLPTEREEALARDFAGEWERYVHVLVQSNEFIFID